MVQRECSMIVITDRKIIFVTPPKCGSSTLHKHFCINNNKYVIGPQFDSRNGRTAIDKHTYIIPYEFLKFEKYIFVRNPYTRAVSLYNHYISYEKSDINFDSFLEEVLINSISNVNFYSPLSQYSYHNCYDNFIQLEFMNEYLLNLKLDPPNIKENVSYNKIKLSNYHKKIIQLWAKEDFKNYNYNM